MAIQGKITSLYTDKTMSEALLPRTNTKAITDDKGVNLNAILDQVAYVDAANSEAAVAPLNADTLAGFPADNYASKTYVSNEIAKAQLGGGSGEGDIDLSGFATKDDISILATKEELNAIDFPVDSVNGKTGTVQLSASDVGAAPSGYGLGGGSTVKKVTDIVANGWYITNEETPTTAWYLCHAFVTNNGKDVTVEAWHLDGTTKWKRTKRGGIWGEWKTMCDAIGALPLSGGKINGELWIGNNLSLKTDNEGGRIRIYPPNAAESGVDFWEIDSYNGKNLRIFADRNANHELGDGYGFALSLDAGGSLNVGAPVKTRENLGVAPSGYGLGTASGKPVEFSKLDTAKEFGMWSLWTGGTLNNIAFTFAKMLVLPLDSNAITQMLFPHGLPGCVLTRDCMGDAWGPWECYNPPMQVGVEYRTTERQNQQVVYVKRVDCGAAPSNASKMVRFADSNVRSVVRVDAKMENDNGFSTTLPILETNGTGIGVHATSSGEIYIVSTENAAQWTWMSVDVYYTKD